MKNIYTFLIIILATITIKAQQDVYLKINHKLGSVDFDTLTTAANNLNNSFQVTRMYYYISKIKLTYDGGQSTTLNNTYIMVDARKPVNELLGNFNFTTLESIEFGIGVDQSKNHSDITLYPQNHALSYQNPSMHWGWAAGYRFVAFEGLTGTSMNQVWQLHALGDKNYGPINPVITAGDKNGSDLIIALDADYTKAAENLSINPNLNYHGEDQQAPLLLSNFRSEVFTKGSASVGLTEVGPASFTMAPNPTTGMAKVKLDGNQFANGTITITDLTGKVVNQQAVDGQKEINIALTQSGLYLISLSHKGNVISTKKLVVQ